MLSTLEKVPSAKTIGSTLIVMAILLGTMGLVACGSGDTGGAATATDRAATAAEAAATAAQEASAAAQRAAVSMSSGSADTASAVASAEEAATAARAAASAANEAIGAARQSADAVGAGNDESAAALAAALEAGKAAEEAGRAAQTAAKAAEEASAAAREAAASGAEAASAAQQSAGTTGKGASYTVAAVAAAEEAAKAAQGAAQAAEEASTAARLAVAATNGGSRRPGSLVVYSGRSESLVGPIIEQFKEATGIDVQVKYGSTSAVAATLQEEGSNSPADLFWAQDPGALGVLVPMFKPLPSDVVLAVPEWARHDQGRWVGVSGRARVIVYNTDLSADELPKSVQELADPKWKGRVGWPPTNASFRVMVTAMRHLWGEDETRDWLQGMLANETKVFPKNTPIVAAAGAGEVDVGLVNHYYLHRFVAEQGDEFGARNLFLNDSGPGSLVMVAGTGILNTSTSPENAEAFVRFLLSRVAQQYFAASTYEYPLVEGVKTHHLLPPIDSLIGPEIDFELLDDLAGTEALLRETGVIP